MRNVGDKFYWWRGLDLEDFGDDVASSAAFECRSSGDEFVDHGSQAENVTAGVNLNPAGLLRRHILRRAQYHSRFTGRRSNRRSQATNCPPNLFLAQLGAAEIQDLHNPIG